MTPAPLTRRRVPAARSVDVPRRAAGIGVFTVIRALLVLFHIILLCDRLSDASILDPKILAKWIAGALLVSATFLAQRLVPGVMRTRRAGAVFWLFVLLLHVAVPVGETADTLHVELSSHIAAAVAFAILATFATGTAASTTITALRQEDASFRARSSLLRNALFLRAPPLPTTC